MTQLMTHTFITKSNLIMANTIKPMIMINIGIPIAKPSKSPKAMLLPPPPPVHSIWENITKLNITVVVIPGSTTIL